ncbi:MAG: hypothetical protein SFU98_04550 [Leptospiraceae bacterium]|nr:hypothetical protein [Leptospiraceae bacterium]
MKEDFTRNEGFKSLVTEYIKDISKGLRIGLGILIMLGTGALLAVAVSGTINTFSSGQVLDATAMNTNFNSLKTAIEGIPSQKAMRLIYENDITAPTTSVNITGLDGDSDVIYEIYFRIVGAGSVADMNLRPNADSTTSYNCRNMYNQSNSGTTAHFYNDAHTGFFLTSAGGGSLNGATASGRFTLYAKTGNFRTWNGYSGKAISTSDYMMNHYFCWYTNTSTNITSLQITGNTANGIGAGSRIEIWSKR